MEPRTHTSLPWTTLPEEFIFKVLLALEKEFPAEAKRGEFLVEGRIYPGELLIRIGFIEKGRLRQMNFEASLDYNSEKNDAIENLYLCIDCLGVWMQETFKLAEHDEDPDLPLVWRATDFQNRTVFLQYSSVNSRLEAEADRLLALAEGKALEDKLFKEAAEPEDALEAAVIDPDLSIEKVKARREDREDLH